MMPVVMKPEPREQSNPAPQMPVLPAISSASVPVATPSHQAVHTSSDQVQSNSISVDGQVPDDIENRIDVESIKGVFGWTTVDGVNIPYIIRKYKKFVSVRIVEKKLLSRYPNAFPDELAKKDPLVSFFVTEYEAKLLDEINTRHCSYEYGNQSFTTKELIVDLVEFEDFYNLVKKTFPDEVLAKMRSNNDDNQESISSESPVYSREVLEKLCAWIQINNTVTPVIKRKDFTFVPLSVIKYAAGLLKNVNLEGMQPSLDDCSLLNETCKIAGFDFQFGPKTKLIELSEIIRHCQPTILQLPFDDPLKHARYLDTPSPGPSGQPPAMSPTAVPHSSPPSMPNPQIPTQYQFQRPNVPVNPFAMMQMMTRSLVPQQLAYSQPGLMPNAMANSMQRLPYNPQRPTINDKPSHPSQMQQQMNSGKPPIYSHGYNQSLPPGHPGHPANMNNMNRVNFPQEHMNLPGGHSGPPFPFQRHTVADIFPPNQNFPHTNHGGRSMPPISEMSGITSNAGNSNNRTQSSTASSVSAPANPLANQQTKPTEKPSKSVTPPANKAVSNKPNTSNTHLKIEGVVLNGKSISCLNLNRGDRQGQFCLVEAVCKLYFSKVNINEFLFVLQNVFKVPLYGCMDDEEKAFIQYYNLPVNMLKCNKMVHLSDLEGLIPRMTYIINQRYSENEALKKKTTEQKPSDQEENPSVQSEKAPISRKRPPSGQGGPESKQSCHLEQIMQRLIQKNQSSEEDLSKP